MPRFEHNRLLADIARLDALPEDAAEYSRWIKAPKHLTFLQENAKSNELAILVNGPFTFVHTVMVDQDKIASVDRDDLLRWNGTPSYSRASYVWGGGRDDVWVQTNGDEWDSRTLKLARPLVFLRMIDGLTGKERVSYEILQEYAHVEDIFWREEQHAYSKFDMHGDWTQIVSVTSKDKRDGITVVSFSREHLDQFLAASNSVLVRMFDFELLRRSNFVEWPKGAENEVRLSQDLFYRQKVDPEKAAYTRGVQIIRPRSPSREIFESIKSGLRGPAGIGYVEFSVWDRRNQRLASVSTDPSASTSYFDATENTLPFEVSPAFFRPEVLLKYKADKQKYTIDEEHRTIYCRGGWSLRTYDINEAGQVHTHIRYLRELPYKEQLYWLSFNEHLKTDISERAFLNDYLGQPADIVDPLVTVVLTVKAWSESGVAFWRLRDDKLLEQVNTPRTASRQEWAQGFSDLSKLVVEGFEIPVLRAKLKEMIIPFDKDEKSLSLIEKVLIGSGMIPSGSRLDGLRAVQEIRSKVASHVGGARAVKLEREAATDHGTFSAHFESICTTVVQELKMIERALS